MKGFNRGKESIKELEPAIKINSHSGLICAIQEGNLSAVKYHLSKNENANFIDDISGYRPILLAAVLGHHYIVDYLYKDKKIHLRAIIISTPTYLKGEGDAIFGIKIATIKKA